jgi:hypothetical protein
MRRLVLITLVTIGASLFAPQSGRACSCTSPSPPLVALERADAVFTGIVLSIEPTTDSHMLVVSFLITGAWKGVSFVTTVFTSGSSASCGFTFQESKEYIVYTHRYVLACCGLKTMTDMCTRTKLISQAQEDLDGLGKPEGLPLEPATWGRVKALYE